jgi:putative oxidoreductase
MKNLFETDAGWSGLILRVMLGVVMFPHGTQKLLGWFGGYGYSVTISAFTDKLHLPAAFALLVIIGESFGAIGLICGFLSRIAAFGILCIMIGAIAKVHWSNGFFMNWSGRQAGEGFEYHLLAIAISAAILIGGGGRWSVDRAIAARLDK